VEVGKTGVVAEEVQLARFVRLPEARQHEQPEEHRVATELISKVVSPVDPAGQEGQEGRAAGR
jgi:hypothetical protein